MHDRLTSFQDPGDYDLPFPGRMRGAGGGAPRCLSSALGNIQRKISHAAHEIILSGDLGSFCGHNSRAFMREAWRIFSFSL